MSRKVFKIANIFFWKNGYPVFASICSQKFFSKILVLFVFVPLLTQSLDPNFWSSENLEPTHSIPLASLWLLQLNMKTTLVYHVHVHENVFVFTFPTNLCDNHQSNYNSMGWDVMWYLFWMFRLPSTYVQYVDSI